MAKESAVAATANQNAANNVVSTIVETKINSVVFTTKHSGDEENGFDYLVAVVKTNTAISAVRAAENGNELNEKFNFSVRANKLFAQISSLKEEEIVSIKYAIWRKEKAELSAMSAEEAALSGFQPDTHVDLSTWEKLLKGATIKLSLENRQNDDNELYTVKDIVDIEFGFEAKALIGLAKSKFDENLQLYMGL